MEKKIDLFKVFMSPKAADEVAKVLNSGYIGQGPKVEEFEKNLKTLFNLNLNLNSKYNAKSLSFILIFLFNLNDSLCIS